MSTTTTTEDPPIDIKTLSEQDKKELMIGDTVSIASDTTLGVLDATFIPVKTLHINAKGISVLRLSTPPSERAVTISNPDGSLVYTSTRARLSSGNCTLTDADGKALVGTEYFFGPSKDPVLNRLDTDEGMIYEIKTLSKWTSRNHKFLLPDGRTFEWRYKREKGFGANGVKGTALVLNVGERRLAMLIRNDETRTLGSKSCSAGNGGELLLGDDVGGKIGIKEDLVVATCLLMLKKEIDRRRNW
ncbi:hypothetical protein BU25DRAFT_407255 [Macroventuria anomochaeta]|uniref:Uncharacterized protein n=1 Tax=Macroventuria anomochaeta TaxID=301207 RepID=A0ACB6SEU4_9PLEO|nr:uncharacterized protein BU25DRAFT_407255 [Macroventuria anomochaeta]KAF2631612.1 hypothetical protein BU25DRAFT_407255 [Macroventuria anomochaeta]